MLTKGCLLQADLRKLSSKQVATLDRIPAMQMDKQHRKPPPRGGLAIVSVSTRIVIFGGADRSPTLYDDLWVLETGESLADGESVVPQ